LTPSDPVLVATTLARVFEAIGVPYLLGGSLASSVYGFARATADVDMAAAVSSEHVSALVAALADSFYVDASMIHDAIQRRGSFNVIHLPTIQSRAPIVVHHEQTPAPSIGVHQIQCRSPIFTEREQTPRLSIRIHEHKGPGLYHILYLDGLLCCRPALALAHQSARVPTCQSHHEHNACV